MLPLCLGELKERVDKGLSKRIKMMPIKLTSNNSYDFLSGGLYSSP
jgi:hypothetical protein